METTSGHLLDGRVVHRQPRGGHRTGIEPVLLAAAVPARPGESVLEGGCGSGAGLLCVAARVSGVIGAGLEIDAAMADLARANIQANGFDGLGVVTGDIARFRAAAPFDHAFANPPWHAASGTASPDAAREIAKRAGDGLFGIWVASLARALRHRGTLTLIVATSALPDCLAAIAAASCGSIVVLPLWRRQGEEARLVVLQAVRGGRGATRLLPGLALHHLDGSFTDAANAVLRGGAALQTGRQVSGRQVSGR
jgi:tRNA1(Val) A37 N6-methylase TrmN6